MTTFKVNNLYSITVSEDGRTLDLTFESTKNSKVKLEIASIEMTPIIQKILGVLSVAESKSSLSNQGIISAMSPSQTRASLTEDGEAVMISFRLQSTIQYHFALPANDALRLGQQILNEAQKHTQSPSSKPH